MVMAHSSRFGSLNFGFLSLMSPRRILDKDKDIDKDKDKEGGEDIWEGIGGGMTEGMVEGVDTVCQGIPIS